MNFDFSSGRNLLDFALPALAALALLGAAPRSLSAQAAGDTRSVLEGVYTSAQAEEGRKTFEGICSNCHNAGNPLSGRAFLTKWSDRPMYSIWEYVTTRMPYGAPGSLTPEQYASVLAYILSLNGYPAGEAALPHLPFEIANIDFDLRPEP